MINLWQVNVEQVKGHLNICLLLQLPCSIFKLSALTAEMLFVIFFHSWGGGGCSYKLSDF